MEPTYDIAYMYVCIMPLLFVLTCVTIQLSDKDIYNQIPVIKRKVLSAADSIIY